MNLLEGGGMALLAEQSIFAQLVIRHKPALVLDVQKDSERYVRTYDPKVRVNDVNTNEYSITNLPALMRTIPRNSIYDYIMFVPPECPDYRFVNVDGSTSLNRGPTLQTLPTSDKLNEVNLNKTTRTALLTKGGNLLSNLPPLDPEDSSANVLDDPRYANLGSIRSINLQRSFPNLLIVVTNELNKAESNLQPVMKEVALQMILDKLPNMTAEQQDAVIEGRDQALVAPNVKVGVALALTKQMGDSMLIKINDTTSTMIASQISQAVDAYARDSGAGTSSSQ